MYEFHTSSTCNLSSIFYFYGHICSLFRLSHHNMQKPRTTEVQALQGKLWEVCNCLLCSAPSRQSDSGEYTFFCAERLFGDSPPFLLSINPFLHDYFLPADPNIYLFQDPFSLGAEPNLAQDLAV